MVNTAFGETYALNTAISVENRYTYTGREKNSASGTMYYRYRTYEQSLGRFVHRDPIGVRGGLNLYLYVSARPLHYKDPNGLCKMAINGCCVQKTTHIKVYCAKEGKTCVSTEGNGVCKNSVDRTQFMASGVGDGSSVPETCYCEIRYTEWRHRNKENSAKQGGVLKWCNDTFYKSVDATGRVVHPQVILADWNTCLTAKQMQLLNSQADITPQYTAEDGTPIRELQDKEDKEEERRRLEQAKIEAKRLEEKRNEDEAAKKEPIRNFDFNEDEFFGDHDLEDTYTPSGGE